jgi:DNA-binding MarR family transcriptional regulator
MVSSLPSSPPTSFQQDEFLGTRLASSRAWPWSTEVSASEGGIPDGDLVTAWGLVLEGTSRAGRLLGAELQTAVGLPSASVEVLFRLLRTEGHALPTTRLAREVAFSSGGFTKVVTRLADAGLVERRPCGSDRRVVYTALTDAGADVAARALAVHVDGLRRHVLGALGPRRLAAMATTMRVLRDSLPPA